MEIGPTADFMLWNHPCGIYDGIKAVQRRKGHEIR